MGQQLEMFPEYIESLRDRCPCGKLHQDPPDTHMWRVCRFFWHNPIGFIAIALAVMACELAYIAWRLS